MFEVERFIVGLRNNPYINERRIDDDVSAFNFTRQAFFKGIWDDITEKARGLFIDTRKGRIMARGYDKFFNIGERPETQWENLELEYPVTAYIKENGYLGLVSYDPRTNDFFIATKGSTTGEHAEHLRKMINEIKPAERQILLNYLRNLDVTAVFEVCDSDFDPHIVKYDKPRLVLLDFIYNDIHFDTMPYEWVCFVADKIGIEHKIKYFISDSKESLGNTLKCLNNTHEIEIEGLVLVDNYGRMLKFKTYWYRFWKEMRYAGQRIRKHGEDVKFDSVCERFPEYADVYPILAYVIENEYPIGTEIDSVSLKEKMPNIHFRD